MRTLLTATSLLVLVAQSGAPAVASPSDGIGAACCDRLAGDDDASSRVSAVCCCCVTPAHGSLSPPRAAAMTAAPVHALCGERGVASWQARAATTATEPHPARARAPPPLTLWALRVALLC